MCLLTYYLKVWPPCCLTPSSSSSVILPKSIHGFPFFHLVYRINQVQLNNYMKDQKDSYVCILLHLKLDVRINQRHQKLSCQRLESYIFTRCPSKVTSRQDTSLDNIYIQPSLKPEPFKKTSIYFARADDAKIVRSRDAQSNTEETPFKSTYLSSILELKINHVN